MASVATATAAAAAASTTTVAAPDALATHAGGVDVGVSTSSPITTPAVVVTAAGTENGHAAAAPTAMSKAVAGGGGETGTARTLEPVRATDSWGVSVHVVRGRNLAAKDSNGKSDPYVKVYACRPLHAAARSELSATLAGDVEVDADGSTPSSSSSSDNACMRTHMQLTPATMGGAMAMLRSTKNWERRKMVKTSIQMGTLSPAWNTCLHGSLGSLREVMLVECWDYDRLSHNDYMGGFVLLPEWFLVPDIIPPTLKPLLSMERVGLARGWPSLDWFSLSGIPGWGVVSGEIQIGITMMPANEYPDKFGLGVAPGAWQVKVSDTGDSSAAVAANNKAASSKATAAATAASSASTSSRADAGGKGGGVISMAARIRRARHEPSSPQAKAGATTPTPKSAMPPLAPALTPSRSFGGRSDVAMDMLRTPHVPTSLAEEYEHFVPDSPEAAARIVLRPHKHTKYCDRDTKVCTADGVLREAEVVRVVTLKPVPPVGMPLRPKCTWYRSTRVSRVWQHLREPTVQPDSSSGESNDTNETPAAVGAGAGGGAGAGAAQTPDAAAADASGKSPAIPVAHAALLAPVAAAAVGSESDSDKDDSALVAAAAEAWTVCPECTAAPPPVAGGTKLSRVQLSDPSAMNSAAGAALYTTQLMRDADKDDFQRYLCLDDVGHWLCAIVEWPAVKGKPQKPPVLARSVGPVQAAPPKLRELWLEGAPCVGNTLVAHAYYLGGAQGPSRYKWYAITDEGERLVVRQAVSRNDDELEVDASIANCNIKVTCVPVRIDGKEGYAQTSKPTPPVAPAAADAS